MKIKLVEPIPVIRGISRIKDTLPPTYGLQLVVLYGRKEETGVEEIAGQLNTIWYIRNALKLLYSEKLY